MITPLGNNVVVEYTTEEKKSAGGIILAIAARSDHPRVVSIGSSVEEVKVGDTVALNVHSLREFQAEGKTYYKININEIYAIL